MYILIIYIFPDDEEDDEVHVLIYDNETQQWAYKNIINESVTQSKNKDIVNFLLESSVQRYACVYVYNLISIA